MAQRKSMFKFNEIDRVEAWWSSGLKVIVYRAGNEVASILDEGRASSAYLPLDCFSRPELLALRRFVIGDTAGNASRDELVSDLAERFLDDGVDGITNKKFHPYTKAETSSSPKRKRKRNKQSNNTSSNGSNVKGSSMGIEQAIIDIIANAGIIDEERVAQIVDERIGNRPQVKVKVGSAPEVDFGSERPHHMMERVLRVVQAGLVPMLVGPAGTGKTTLAGHVAKAMGLDYGEMTCSPDSDDSHFYGFRSPIDGKVYDGAPGKFIREGGVFAFDEVDQCDPTSLKGANPIVRRAKRVGLVDGVVDRHEDFHPIVIANTYGFGSDDEYMGNQLDSSTMDGWVVIPIGYDEALERDLAGSIAGSAGHAWCAKVHAIRGNQVAQRIRAVISTRMVEHGASLVAAGFSEREAWEMTGGRYSDDIQGRLLAGVTLDSSPTSVAA